MIIFEKKHPPNWGVFCLYYFVLLVFCVGMRKFFIRRAGGAGSQTEQKCQKSHHFGQLFIKKIKNIHKIS